VIFGNTTASNTTAIGSNFNVSTQETSTFYQGFLKPIDLQTLDYFIRQGYPREMLFWLFTDSFHLERGGHKTGYYYSPPDDYGCSREDPKHRCFIDWVRNATLAGLTVEEKTLQKSASSSGGGQQEKSPETPGGGGKTQTTIFARFCFSSVLRLRAAALMTPDQTARLAEDSDVTQTDLYHSDLTCGSDQWKPEQDTGKAQADILPLWFKGKGIVFSIVPRSAYGVFEFLGTLMKMRRLQMQVPGGRYYPPNHPYVPDNRPYVLEPPELWTVHEDPELLQVLYNLGGDCFVHTWFRDGGYCVPEEAATTKRIFGLLAQLIAIQTAAGDLSITPIVRVIQ
jgi:hypothetical protein